MPLALPLVVSTAIHLAAHLFTDGGALQEVTKGLLMPSLALLLVGRVAGSWRGPHSRLVRIVLVALLFSWLGDIMPGFVPEGAAFLTMVGFFFVAQCFYIAALAPRWRASVARRAPIALLPYAAVLVTLVVLCREQAGALFVPVLCYGVALATMAVLTTSLGWLGGLGGAIFLLSDSLIAIGAFTDIAIPQSGFWVMATYVLGQTLIVLAVARREAGARRSR